MKQLSVVSCQLSVVAYRKFFIIGLFLLVTGNCLSSNVSAQGDEQKDTAPPPLKIISKEETRLLNTETDIKKRTKLALELMETRLKKAEELNSQERFSEMFDELGCFHALIDKSIEFLDQNDNGGGKVLNNFKRVEMSLRAFLPRLELIRRDLPERYEFYVRNLAKHVRQARSKAIEPFFGDSIVKDSNN
jgi:hypothetical protein